MKGQEQKRPLFLSLGMLFKQCSGSYLFKRRDNAGMGTQNSAEEETRKGTPRPAERESTPGWKLFPTQARPSSAPTICRKSQARSWDSLKHPLLLHPGPRAALAAATKADYA